MRFSQRIGLTPAGKIAQRESVDDDLRNSLWSALTIFFWDKYERPQNYTGIGRDDVLRGSNLYVPIRQLWLHYFKKPIDTIEVFWKPCLAGIRRYYFDADWHEVYDFIEYLSDITPDGRKEDFIKVCNSYLERENSAYRFVGGTITEITSEAEINEVDRALENVDSYSGVRTHLSTALTLMSSKTNPDYRNSVKESISAIESLAKQLANDEAGTLDSALKSLERTKKIHPALKRAFSALYGYTSDADGIRHGLLEESSLTKADARFMLISCSSFINYCIDTARR